MNKLLETLRNKIRYQIPNEGTPAASPVVADPSAPVTPPSPDPSLAPLISQDPPAAQAPAESPAPLSADAIKLPEGVEVNQEIMTEFLGVMNDAELSPGDRAQKLIDLQVKATEGIATAAHEAGMQLWRDTQVQWQEAAKALPGIGGDQLPATLATIKKGLETVGATKETFEALTITGAGNHPEIIRVLHSLTKHLSEGAPVSGSPTRAPLTAAQKLFGNKSE